MVLGDPTFLYAHIFHFCPPFRLTYDYTVLPIFGSIPLERMLFLIPPLGPTSNQPMITTQMSKDWMPSYGDKSKQAQVSPSKGQVTKEVVEKFHIVWW